jgi:TolB-like protein
MRVVIGTMSLINELKRRNVFRVAAAYAVIAWALAQVADLAFDNFGTPDWVPKTVLFVLVLGFPLAIFFAWAFEMTPEGVKKEKDVDRSQSITHQTGQKLNWVIMAVLVVAVGLLLADKFVLRDEGAPSAADVTSASATNKSVAVLPFVAMSSGPDDEYFADGLTEEILNSLTRVPQLLVTARTSAFHFKGQDVPIPDIAATLGVAHIVEGSVRRSGERLRVTAQLIRAEDGFHLWSETYDHDTSDAFGVQTDIAEKIASALDVVLDDEQLKEMRSVGLQNPEAYVAFQKGVELFHAAHGAEDANAKLLVANEWFEKTMALAPEFSDSYSYHADYFTHVLSVAGAGGASEDELHAAMASLEDDLTKAMQYAPDEGRRNVNAYDLDLITGRWRGLQSRFDQIVEQNRCYQANWYEIINSPFGNAADVRKLSQRAVECDPLAFSGWMILSTSSQWLGDFEAAIETSRLGFETTGHRILMADLVNSLISAGRFDEATTIIEREYRDESGQLSRFLQVAAAQGDEITTTTLLDQYESVAPQRTSFMIAAARAGQRERANAVAAEVDSVPYGYFRLIRALHGCICGAPFDLEAAPNFAKRIEDAGLPWPPLSPVNWPLKDW